MQAAWTQLVVSLDADERDTDTERQLQFIVGELVNVAINLDYGDEIGRRKMFELMRKSVRRNSSVLSADCEEFPQAKCCRIRYCRPHSSPSAWMSC